MASMLESANTILTLVKNGWVPRHYAVDETGKDCEPWSDRASKWCAIGAIQAVTYYEDGETANGPRCKLMHTLYDSANAGELLGNLNGRPMINDPTRKWYGNTAMQVEHTNDASSQEHAIRRMTRLVQYIERKALDWNTVGHKVTHTTKPPQTQQPMKPFGVK